MCLFPVRCEGPHLIREHPFRELNLNLTETGFSPQFEKLMFVQFLFLQPKSGVFLAGLLELMQVMLMLTAHPIHIVQGFLGDPHPNGG